jgi:hypothetical protein
MDTTWILTAKGTNETFGQDGYPNGCTEYSIQYGFDTFNDLVNFMKLHQSRLLEYCSYEIDTI